MIDNWNLAPQEFSTGKFKRLRGLRYATTLRYEKRDLNTTKFWIQCNSGKYICFGRMENCGLFQILYEGLMTILRYLICIIFWVLLMVAGWVELKERRGWFAFIGWSVTMTIFTGYLFQYFKTNGKKGK